MKNIIYRVLVLSLAQILVFGCTTFEENIKLKAQDFKILTSETIDTDLKVANLVVNQSEFDEMYTNYLEDIEIEGKLTLYKDGVTLIEGEVIEIQIKGAFSSSYPLKSLGIKFDKTYKNKDRKLIDVETLPNHSLDKIKAFRFRNSGNDFQSTMIKDMCYTKLALDAGLNLDLMYAEQSVVFLNGVFLGVMNIRTESNTNGMYRLHGAKKDDITYAKISDGGVVEKKDGDFDRIDNLIKAIEDGDSSYVSKEIDIDNFIDYMIFESYVGNSDWPQNNVRIFAVKNEPFRFILYDLDHVGLKNMSESPMSFINSLVKNPITDLFNLLYANAEFKNAYDSRFKYLMDSKLIGSAKFNAIVTDYKSNIEQLIPLQIAKYKSPENFTQWYMNIEHLKNNFAIREKHVISSIK